VNHPTVGRVPNGATVEKLAPSVPLGKVIHLQLRDADFTTAARIADTVNQRLGSGHLIAHAANSALVTVELPANFVTEPIQFMSELERLPVKPDHVARVIVNERTGTVVLGQDVRIAPVAVMHGNLTVSIQTTYQVAMPSPDTQAQPAVVPQTTVMPKDEKSRNIVLQEGATVEELVKALSSIGSTTRDVIAILENLRAAGALDADLEVI
jgi:flagellar P-ring protein precursor FlgI